MSCITKLLSIQKFLHINKKISKNLGTIFFSHYCIKITTINSILCNIYSIVSFPETVTSCKGISALVRTSWLLVTDVLTVPIPETEPCWILARISVVPPAVIKVSSGVASTDASTVLLGWIAFLFWCVLMCLARWSLLMKRFEHSGQTNFFSPVENTKGKLSFTHTHTKLFNTIEMSLNLTSESTASQMWEKACHLRVQLGKK